MTISRRTFLAIGGAGAASFVARPLHHSVGRLGNLIASRGTDFEALRRSIKGSLILPSDAPYERARRVWSFNPRTDLRPAGGGHDILGASTCDGGLVIDLSAMKHIDVDETIGRVSQQTLVFTRQ